ALLNYQTMVTDLTKLPLANASLLDEATAAAEAMFMFYNSRSQKQVNSKAVRFFVSKNCFPQTIDVIQTRAVPVGIEVELGDHNSIQFDDTYFGALIQYPDADGEINDYGNFIEQARLKEIQ